MNTEDERFLTTRQEPLRLSIAVARYFGGEVLDPPLKERYEKFLRQRVRSALLLVIREGNLPALEGLVSGNFLSDALYQEAILKSVEEGKSELTVFLLQNQQKQSGSGKDPLELDF